MKFGLRESVFMVMLVSLPLGAWWLVFRPQNARNEHMTAQIEAKQKKLRALNQVTATIGDLQKEIAAQEDAFRYFQKKLPNEKEIDKVLQEIWRTAELNELKTKSIRTLTRTGNGAAASPDGPHEQPIAVQLEGRFTGFYTFLQAIENQPRIMRITKMSLKTEEKDNDGNVVANFEMSVFFEKEGKGKEWPSKT